MIKYLDLTSQHNITNEAQKIVLRSICSGKLDVPSSIAIAYRWPEAEIKKAANSLINNKILENIDGRLKIVPNQGI